MRLGPKPKIAPARVAEILRANPGMTDKQLALTLGVAITTAMRYRERASEIQIPVFLKL